MLQALDEHPLAAEPRALATPRDGNEVVRFLQAQVMRVWAERLGS